MSLSGKALTAAQNRCAGPEDVFNGKSWKIEFLEVRYRTLTKSALRAARSANPDKIGDPQIFTNPDKFP
jgi:hypothetical protein